MRGPRPRVFVSSVIDGFQEFRAAARRGIEAGGGEPVLVNEDFPSSTASPRNACLDAIDSCDALLSIIGERGGTLASSGKLVVEEEYDHARLRALPILAFLRSGPRDERAARFARTVSDFVDGHFRHEFKGTTQLEQQTTEAVRALPVVPSSSSMNETLSRMLAEPAWIQGDAALRVVLVSERAEELIAPQQLSSAGLREALYTIGHAPGVAIFSYEQPKGAKVERATLTITQDDSHARHHGSPRVRVKLDEQGNLSIESNVTGREARQGASGMMNAFVVATADIEEAIRGAFAFCVAVLDHLDPYKRHFRLHYNTALFNLGYRTIVRASPASGPTTMNLRDERAIIAFGDARTLTRDQLRAPQAEVDRIVTVLERTANR